MEQRQKLLVADAVAIFADREDREPANLGLRIAQQAGETGEDFSFAHQRFVQQQLHGGDSRPGIVGGQGLEGERPSLDGFRIAATDELRRGRQFRDSHAG